MSVGVNVIEWLKENEILNEWSTQLEERMWFGLVYLLMDWKKMRCSSFVKTTVGKMCENFLATSSGLIIMFYWLRLLAPQDLCWSQLILSFRWQEPHPMTVHRELYLSNMYFFICDLKEQNDIALFVTFFISSFGAVCKKYGSSKRIVFLYFADFG